MVYQPQMELSEEERNILARKEGETKAKMMECLVRYGDIFHAKRMVKVTHRQGHLVTSFGLQLLTPIYPLMDELIQGGLVAPEGFTADPLPLDYPNVSANPLEKLVFNHFMYSTQDHYQEQLKKVGMRDEKGFSCTCYLKENGNTPKEGDILSWAESSAVVFANSVLGARCNRNSGVYDLFGTILGVVPEFGFLTDEGRKADYRVIIRCSRLPEAQILGSAIGMKVMEKVPYVIGLGQWLKDLPDEDTIAYLKDFGAATASNGAVGLYHIEGITPEAKRLGQSLLKPAVKEYIIDDEEIERVCKSYPVMWKNRSAKPHKCFIGCPHLTLKQLVNWTEKLSAALKEQKRKKVVIDTVFTSSPHVIDAFKKTDSYSTFLATGAHLSYICPLMYIDNPLVNRRPLLTNSNKLRTYTKARYEKDEKVLALISGKESY